MHQGVFISARSRIIIIFSAIPGNVKGDISTFTHAVMLLLDNARTHHTAAVFHTLWA